MLGSLILQTGRAENVDTNIGRGGDSFRISVGALLIWSRQRITTFSQLELLLLIGAVDDFLKHGMMYWLAARFPDPLYSPCSICILLPLHRAWKWWIRKMNPRCPIHVVELMRDQSPPLDYSHRFPNETAF